MEATTSNSGVNNMQSSTSSNELVYGGNNSAAGSDESRVMSEKVQMVASAIYKEFEAMIGRFGQTSVKELMPLVVNVLENLDNAYLEKEELVVDLEMLKEENEQLLNQYERERQMRRNQDQKCLEMEETLMEQNRELESKVDSMASIVRMLELKSKNAADHANRLEDREADQKIEYEKLHERYNELLRTHIEHVERTKFLMGVEMFDMAQSLPVNAKNRNMMVMSAVDANVRGISDIISAVHMSQSTHADMNLANHISNERDWHEEFGGQETAADILATPRDSESKSKNDAPEIEADIPTESAQQEIVQKDRLAPNEEGDGISLGADLTGMGREVENLIRENTELLETKNALNIVKNDLIARVDQLSSEREVFREEVRSLELVKLKLGERLRELEAELKELKEKRCQEEIMEEEDMSQRKRFTRVEMARVLMERNQYKEKLIELQEAVKFTESQRAKKINSTGSQNRSINIWNFFSNLLGDNSSSSSPTKTKNGMRRSATSPSPAYLKKATRASDVDMDFIDNSVKEKRMAERRQHYRAVSQHMKKEDFPTAYGWSVAPKSSQDISIPVPVNCRPLLRQLPSLKIWCADSCALHGGLRNGEYIVGNPLQGCDPYLVFRGAESQNEQNGLHLRKPRVDEFEILESSSLIWICSSNEQNSSISILDGNNPSAILDTFMVESAHLLCITSVAGIHEDDSRISDEGLSFSSELCSTGNYVDKEKLSSDFDDREAFGSVEFVILKKSVEGDIPTYVAATDENPSPKRKRDNSTSHSPHADDMSADNDSESAAVNNNKSALRRTKAVTFQDTLSSQNDQSENENRRSSGEETNKDICNFSADKLPLHIRDTLKLYEAAQEEELLTLPLMWLGVENDFIYIHSAIREWRRCIRRIKMKDSVLSILHSNGRVFCALANGGVAVFHRDTTGRWSEKGYHLIRLGDASHSVCHLCMVENNKLWAAYRNCVVIIDPVSLRIEDTLTAHPRRDSQVRQMVAFGSGVWFSIRLDSNIRLFHSQTLQHLQDIDIESFISKMLGTNKLDFLYMRITSLSILNRRIWIGTGSGVIISIPLSETEKTINAARGRAPGQVLRVVNSQTEANSTIPFCDITKAQLSFHGHKDAVRFLLPVHAEGFSDLTQNLVPKKLFMISGGDGYIDFRLGEDDEAVNDKESRMRDMSHLLIWETECSFNFIQKNDE